jgi:hypothetical protein
VRLYRITAAQAAKIDELNQTSINKLIVCCHDLEEVEDLWVSFDDLAKTEFEAFKQLLTVDEGRSKFEAERARAVRHRVDNQLEFDTESSLDKTINR